MTIDISAETIRKLEHKIHEIRTRAINNVQSKFQSCRTDLQDLVVDVHDLIQHLMKWFDLKPVTNVKQIFEILLILLKSKYQNDTIRILKAYSKRGDLQRIGIYAEDSVSKEYFDEIIQILRNHRVEFVKQPKNDTSHEKYETSKAHQTPRASDTYESWKFKDINANGCNRDGLQFEAAWEVLGQKELQALSTMKSSLSTKHSQSELNHALQYFQQYIQDFPGEFFLQTPFIFLNLLKIIESEVKDFNHTPALECCLKLTQSLARRVKFRRVSCMNVYSTENVTKQQVTIGSYCFKTFDAVLNLLRNIYADSDLASVNECFLILIEIVELICKTANVYTAEVAVEYHFDEIISKLADFLRFIREMTSNYRLNGHKTNRNNSISILFLICRLLMFKENKVHIEEENMRHPLSPQKNDSANDLDISQKIKNLSFKDLKFDSFDQLDTLSSITLDHSESTLDHYVTAIGSIENSICRKELEMAMIDYPLQHFYPQVSEIIVYALKVDSLPEKSLPKLLLNLTEQLEPVVTLLRDPKMCSYEKVLSYSLKSINVLSLVKSEDLTQLIFRAITNLTPQYNANDHLRECAERLFQHLLSFECTELKRLVYKMTSDQILSFYEQVMEGKKIVSKPYVSTMPQSYLFGLPMSSEILAEIICNGLSSEDTKTALSAENILTLILRIKSLIPQRWLDICKFLTPVLPLLLCHAKVTTTIGQLILSLVEPGDSELSTVVLIKSSVALLFSRDPNTRGEALFRLLYLLENVPNAEIYMPNLKCITDIISGDVCRVEPLTYSNNEDFCDLYEVHLIESLLEVLQNPGTEPSIRHSTLTQLNIVIEDPVVLQHFYEIDGHSIILRILDRSLQENSTDNYAYNAIQIIGILTKMCLRIPTVRRQLENDIQSYVLIVRSLLLFHTDDKFRRECVVLLFSLAFSGYIVGGNKQLIVPTVCKRLILPIACEFNWKSSLEQQNLLEFILTDENSSQQFGDTNSNYSRGSSEIPDDSTLKMPEIWRYIRFAFNALWFDSLDSLIDSPNYLQGSRNTELNYKNNADSLSFNRKLCATSIDLEIIEGTSPKYGLSFWSKQLKNATTSKQVTLSCAAIEIFFNVDSIGHRKQWKDYQKFLEGITRFCTVIPNNQQDEEVFQKICHLLSNLVERDFIDVHIWLLKKFNKKHCIFIDLITNPRASTTVFISNIQFLESFLRKTIDVQSKPIIHQLVFSSFETTKNKTTTAKSSKSSTTKEVHRNLYEHIFDIAFNRLNTLLAEKKLDEMRCLVSLIHTVALSGEVLDNDYIASFVANKLLMLMLAISSLSYIGSSFNKNCLLTIGHMMVCVDQLRIEKKCLTFLINLCGHVDFEIRTYSWSILLKIASTLSEAKNLVQEMNSLPGGLYACCLNTLLDDTESAIVRENAALVFATLISYRNPNNELNEELYPKSADGMGCDWIGHLLYHHDLMGKIIESIKYLHVKETIDMENNTKIVPCNLMRAYCMIMLNLLPLKGAGDVNPIIMAMHELSIIIPKLQQSVNQSSILLLTEICGLIAQCTIQKKSIVDLIVRDFHVIQSLITFLNVDLLEPIPKSIKHRFYPKILKLLRRLATSPLGLQTICEAFNQHECLDGAITLFIYGLSNKELSGSVMRFLTDLLIMGQTSDFDFVTFADLINELPLSANVKESTKKFIFNADFISQSLVNWLENGESDTTAAEILYKQLACSFERSNDISTSKKLPSDVSISKQFESNCKAIEALLKCSERARDLATNDQFLMVIVDQMEKVISSVGGSLTDFIRRNGNVKAEKHINKLKLLLHMILCWYSADCLKDPDCIHAVISICQKFWPTIGADAELKNVFIKMLMFLTSNSLPVCKAMCSSAQFSIGSSTLLNSIVEFCVAETSKPKTTTANLETLEMTLKTVSNCCCCVEGRLLIAKTRMLHTLTRLHPQVTRNQKPWPLITRFWLVLFEALTRHNDANKEAHLNLLCNLVEAPSVKNRHLALEILRNMSFNNDNRAALLSSSDFQRIMYSVLDKKETGEEQLLITVAIWKLTANNSKGKNVIKNSPISSKLNTLNELVDRRIAEYRLRRQSNLNDENEISPGNETIEDLSVALKRTLEVLNI